MYAVLNLVISGISSIQGGENFQLLYSDVLNLVISGIPSIPTGSTLLALTDSQDNFKPYYNWTAFNTISFEYDRCWHWVLNLVISGIPSIPLEK